MFFEIRLTDLDLEEEKSAVEGCFQGGLIDFVIMVFLKCPKKQNEMDIPATRCNQDYEKEVLLVVGHFPNESGRHGAF